MVKYSLLLIAALLGGIAQAAPVPVSQLMPAPQKQGDYTLNITDAGWQSLEILAPDNAQDGRPVFFFSSNVEGPNAHRMVNGTESYYGPNGAIDLIGARGPNDEPIDATLTFGYPKISHALQGVDPRWEKVKIQWQIPNPDAPAGAVNSTVSFDDIELPAQKGQFVKVGAKAATPRGSTIFLDAVKVNGENTYFSMRFTPTPDAPDARIELHVSGIRYEKDDPWQDKGSGFDGDNWYMPIAPPAGAKRFSVKFDVTELAASWEQKIAFRRFETEIPVAALWKINPPARRDDTTTLARADGQGAHLEIEKSASHWGGGWDGMLWTRPIPETGETPDAARQWLLRRAVARAEGRELKVSAWETQYNDQWVRTNGVAAAPDEHSQKLHVSFNGAQPQKFDLEVQLERAQRYENWEWLREIPLPAPGEETIVSPGQLETDNLQIERIFRFRSADELPGLEADRRADFASPGVAIVFKLTPLFPDAQVRMQLDAIGDNFGRVLYRNNGYYYKNAHMLEGDAGRAGARNTRLRTLLLKPASESKTVDVHFLTRETAWSGERETVVLRDIPTP